VKNIWPDEDLANVNTLLGTKYLIDYINLLLLEERGKEKYDKCLLNICKKICQHFKKSKDKSSINSKILVNKAFFTGMFISNQ